MSFNTNMLNDNQNCIVPKNNVGYTIPRLVIFYPEGKFEHSSNLRKYLIDLYSKNCKDLYEENEGKSIDQCDYPVPKIASEMALDDLIELVRDGYAESASEVRFGFYIYEKTDFNIKE